MTVLDLGQVLSDPLLLNHYFRGEGIEPRPAFGSYRIPDRIHFQLVPLVLPLQGISLINVQQLVESLKVKDLATCFHLVEPCQGAVVTLDVVQLIVSCLALGKFITCPPVIPALIEIHRLLEDRRLKEVYRFDS